MAGEYASRVNGRGVGLNPDEGGSIGGGTVEDKKHANYLRYAAIGALAIVAVALGLIMIRVFLVSGEEPASAKQPTGPYAVIAGMSLGAMMRLDFEEKAKGETVLLCDAGGTLWVFEAPSGGSLYYSKFVDGAATPIGTVVSGWNFIENITASLDAAGNPTVIWAGLRSDEAVAVDPLELGERNVSGTGLYEGQVLAVSTWTGEAWTSPAILDVLGTGSAANTLHSMRDPGGVVHIAYDRKLEPPEDYNIGFILGEGFFPNKCFYVHSQGRGWSTPVATTGRGKFDVRDMLLTSTPDGQVGLSMVIEPPHSAYVGWQKWDGTKWSSVRQVSPDLSSAVTYYGGTFLDKWGTRIIWWDGGDYKYTLTASGSDGVRRSQEVTTFHPPILAFHASGAVLMLCPQDGSRGDLRAWDGQRWTEPVACPYGTYLTASPSGTVYVAGWQEKELVVQEVVLQVREESPEQERAEGG